MLQASLTSKAGFRDGSQPGRSERFPTFLADAVAHAPEALERLRELLHLVDEAALHYRARVKGAGGLFGHQPLHPCDCPVRARARRPPSWRPSVLTLTTRPDTAYWPLVESSRCQRAEASCRYCADVLIPDVPVCEQCARIEPRIMGKLRARRWTARSNSARRWSRREGAWSVPRVTKPSLVASGTTSA